MSYFSLDPSAKEYSPANAYALAKISQLSYDTSENVMAGCGQFGFDHFEFFGGDAAVAAGFLAANEKTIVVCFRGGDDFQDMLTDISIHLTGGPLAGKVHEGFLHELSSIWSDLLPAILQQQSSARSLWFTGHSLGAALSTLAVARCLERAMPVNGLYDYGSPRCGDETFATAFNAKFDRAYRFVYGQDAVTRAPPRLFGYRHVGEVKYIDKNCQITGEMEGWAAYLRDVTYTLGELRQMTLGAIADHQIENYVACLGRQARVPDVTESGT